MITIHIICCGATWKCMVVLVCRTMDEDEIVEECQKPVSQARLLTVSSPSSNDTGCTAAEINHEGRCVQGSA
jgi:hypothetical protein